VVSLHGSDVSVSERQRALGRAARWSFARGAAVTAPSRDLLERARALGAVEPLELIPYGADPDAFALEREAGRTIRRRLGLADDDVAVLGIGRFVHWKGFDDLVDAIGRARERAPGVRLVLVGDGDLRTELEARVSALELGGLVTFTGMAAREDVPVYFAAADVVAVPSVHYAGYVDGLPNVALEAMASGKPLVATRVGGLPSVVDHGENGLLVDEHDPQALAEAIVALAHDPDLRARMGAEGRRRIRAEHNWDAVAERFVAVFERAAAA
jgi:glycosyltransferase involved in cell wall biosynthesis